jgi:hypothetical protein
VFEPVAAAFKGVDVGVVDDSVDHGGGDGLVAVFRFRLSGRPVVRALFRFRLSGRPVVRA